jgi:hypothetical protein
MTDSEGEPENEIEIEESEKANPKENQKPDQDWTLGSFGIRNDDYEVTHLV